MTKTEAFAKVIEGFEDRLVLTNPARVTNTKTDGKNTRFLGGFLKNSSEDVVVEVMVYSDSWINFKAFDSTDRRVRAVREDTILNAKKTLADWLD